MSNDKQSSIEWFSKESLNLKVKLENKKISIGEYAVTYFDLLRQAKAMHKEETIKLYYEYEDYVLREQGIIKTFGQYYNETFGGNK